MKISAVNSVSSFNRNISVSTPVAAQNFAKDKNVFSKNIPASVYKANFLPSFGKYKKVKDVVLLDKDTHMQKNASLMKETVGDYVLYKIMIGRQEAGYMDMDCDSIFPEDKYLCSEADNNIPEIKHLRSLMGDKYYGIGTELINAAVEESKNRGKNGSLWLETEQGYARTLSMHRSNENPIPFYYKMGFRSLDKNLDFLIKNCMTVQKYDSLPPSAVLILSSSDVHKFKDYYCSHYTYSDKSA